MLVRSSLILALLAPQAVDLEPGLLAEYFEGIADFPASTPKPVLVRVEKQVNYGDVSGEFYGSKLESNFYVRWTGTLRVEKAGAYAFFTTSDDGSRLSIGGKTVVENGGQHPMTDKGGKAELAAGDHEIKIEFFQGGGEAGCKADWQPPGAGRQPIPAKALFHKKAAEKIEWDEAAWKKRKGGGSMVKKGSGKFAEMDHGPVYSGTVDALYPGRGAHAHKGIVAKLGGANVLFDTELLKICSGWTGGFVGHPAGRDGLEGQPFADGAIKFGCLKASLGWALGGDWKDPRPKPFGPLPAARYTGLYVSGEKIAFAYKVGGADVLDHPSFANDVFTRVIRAGKSPSGLRMLVCERPGVAAAVKDGLGLIQEGELVTAVGLSGRGAALDAKEGRIELAWDAAGGAVALSLWSGPAADLAAFASKAKAAPVADVEALTKGGPPRNAPVETVGTLGVEPGAYQLDTLTVPFENPSKSYMRLTGVDFFADGKRAAVCTMDGDVWIVSGIDAKLEKLTWRRHASGLFQTLGLRIVDDVIYTLGRDQITRFHDLNKDGEADFYENFNNDCGVTVAYHEYAHDLQTDSQGNFYYAKGSDLGGAKVPQHGAIVKVSKDGATSEVYTYGFRAPNGMSVGPGDIVTSSDNQGNWTPTTPINWFTKKGQFGGYLPCPPPGTKPEERPAPLCWIPYSVDNSGGGQVWATSDTWGPFKNHLIHLSYGKCTMFKALVEKVGDGVQGGVVKFPFKFASGIMRGRTHPVDGQLYVVGMRGWQTDAQREGCFQRVRYTGKPANMPLEAKVTKTGIDITFTDPLDKASEGEYVADWANLKWTAGYGSDEFWVSDPKKKGREKLPIQGAKISADGKTVSLQIDGLKPVYYLSIRYRLKAADGAPVNGELIYTINYAP
ncbi:MAG TPA: PA14 domain-containing protein [Planctomycetota bacterium]